MFCFHLLYYPFIYPLFVHHQQYHESHDHLGLLCAFCKGDNHDSKGFDPYILVPGALFILYGNGTDQFSNVMREVLVQARHKQSVEMVFCRDIHPVLKAQVLHPKQ